MAKIKDPMHGADVTMETVDGKELRVARWRFDAGLDLPPLLFFNGIGANMEAVAPFAEMLTERPFITLDMPGVGGSPDTLVPYNAVWMSRIVNNILNDYDVGEADVMGVSWGGAMAQHFTLQNSARVRKLILAATTAGMFMVPGKMSALTKMANPRRYIDPDYMNENFATLYGGNTDGKKGHSSRLTPPSRLGYLYQLLAFAGWTSAPFLPMMNKETLIMMGGEDNIVRPINGTILETLIPNSKMHLIEDGGHLFLLSHLDECLEAIRQHLDGPPRHEKMPTEEAA
ncbi:alpha/beta fold hydrolase [Alterisphingorhabdus coralli]|uniref:Alpha/beta fold hydrolase n=1 Tax=Alterisphingorhabdus coralli TaxID=3071408 RepID=A0AA97F4W6_9SPHN|nr:alpha/beta fold hydrolase [Parasphingorhabdus sp. SCSIO 66989]WOE74384.1 alpha/beta fold hydrolase [Parasphingorhabdus sp. SCSIO 66989]